jgi:hypothetical protein
VQLWLNSKAIVGPTMDKQDIVESNSWPMPQDSFIAGIEGKGDTGFFCMPLSIGEVANAILGRDTKTGASDPYSHAVDWGATGPVAQPYYTMLVSSFGALYQMYVDLRANHLKVEGNSKGMIMVTVSWVGGVPQFKTSTTLSDASVEKTQRYRFSDGTAAFKFANVALPLPNHFVIDIDRGLTEVPGDAPTPQDTFPGVMSVVGSLDYAPADFAPFNNVVYGGTSPSDATAVTTTPYEPASGVDIKLTQAGVSPARTLEFNMPRIQVDPFFDSPDPTTPGALIRTIPFKAYPTSAGASPITITTQNSQSAAY